ncbi:MAG: ABC transporter substrate-binding protein, partial [Deltaproteobacteria bacterium]|nr:ABC transporter substrate-binding protein [Deltaproteobacteria bacterium]
MNRCSIFKRRRGLLRVVVAILLIAAPTALTACRARSATQEVEATIVVRDGRGRAVRLPRPARRIAALSPSAVEILFRLGCGARVVLRSKMANFPPRARSIPSTDGLRLAAEHIVGFRPDLVLLSHLDPSGVAALEGLGIPVGVFEPRSIEEVFGDMETLGRLCGASGMRLRQEVATLRHRAEAIDRRVAG